MELTQTLVTFLFLYKYVALFVITYLGALAVPLPSSPTLMAAAAFSGQHYLNLWAVVVLAFFGNILGDLSAYGLSRRYGQKVFYKLGLKKVLESKTYDWVATEIQNHKASVVFFSRVNVATTISVNILAGLSKMKFSDFALYAGLGELVQVFFYVAIGYFFGSNWQVLSEIFGQFTFLLVVALLLSMTLAANTIQKRLVLRRRNHIENNK